MTDHTNPDHYKFSEFEAIDVIEVLVSKATDPFLAALQFNVLKYCFRLWEKDTPLRNLRKIQWYVEKMIAKLEKEGAEG